MKDEIKEILIKDFNEILVKEFCTDWKEKRLYIELLVNATPFTNLLDYITNLQTIEQQYSAILSENAELENKITNLQQENKQLKGDIKELFKENENKEKVIILQDNIIKESIEYIKHSQSYGTMAQVMPHLKPYVNGDELLAILGDKE